MRQRPTTLTRFRYAVLLVAILLLSACGGEFARDTETSVPDGDADRGREAFVAYGCTGCHTAAGIRGPEVRIGPSLHDLRENTYIAGALPNEPDNLIAWIMNPQSIEPGTAMPNLGVSDRDARDMAAYLYSQ